MKDRFFIYYGNPCVTRLADPAIQAFDDAREQGPTPCRFYPDRRECSSPDFACVHLAGAAMARYVVQFYSEATEETLAMEREQFRGRAPMPPDKVKAYVEPEGDDCRHITDPEEAVQHVWEYARLVLDLKPGERIFRSSEDQWAPPQEAESQGASTVRPPAA
jgi:hypothetical protein